LWADTVPPVAVILAAASAVLWGAADFGGGLASRRRPAVVVVGWSQCCAFVLLVLVAVATGVRPDGVGWLSWGLAAGVVGAAGLVTFYRALAIGTMGVISPIAALGALVPLAVGVAAGERPGPHQVAGVALALIGAVAASGPELSGAASGRGVGLAVAAGVLFGLTMVFIARGAGTSALLTATAMRLASVVLFGGAALLRRSVGGVRAGAVPALAAIGLGDAGANVLFGIASTLGLTSVVAVLGSLYPVATVLLARAVLGERLRPVQAAGVAAALVGIVLISAG
jgi:drug/metabolite transporter (DMT)-like permease